MAVRKTKKGAALRRWFKEDWRTPSGDKDYSKGDTTFRPTKRVSKDTPTTWSELTPSEIAAAKKEKREKNRVSRYKKKKTMAKKKVGGTAAKPMAKTLVPKKKKPAKKFKAHAMYKDGKVVKAKTMAEHLKLKKLGYGHTKPKMKLGGAKPKKANRLYRKADKVEEKAYVKYEASNKTAKDKNKYLKKEAKSDKIKTKAYKAKVGKKTYKRKYT